MTHNKRKQFVKKFFLLILFFLVLAFFLAGAGFWTIYKQLPSIEILKDFKPKESSIVYDRNGQVIGQFFDERRTVIPVNKLPRHALLAFVAAEDASFFSHRGIDYNGIIRAIIQEIKYRIVGGRRLGGSTITQQTARAMLLSSKQTYTRKLKEIVLALRIEDALSKEEILNLYLNQIYFGKGAYGIEEASQTYFNKPARELELFESAILASIPKSPNRINPFTDYQRLKQRQEYVLGQMSKLGFISKREEEKAKRSRIRTEPVVQDKKNQALYFLEEVKKELVKILGDNHLSSMGLNIYTTLDLSYQRAAERALRRGILELDKRQGYHGPLIRLENIKLTELLSSLKKEKDKKQKLSKRVESQVWDLQDLNLDKIETSIRWLNWQDEISLGVLVKKVDVIKNKLLIDLGSKEVLVSIKNLKTTKKQNFNNISDVFRVGDIILLKLKKSKNKIVAYLEQEPEVNGALVALDVVTGGVLAMVGGYDFSVSPFNRATQAKRQPGSGIKPLIYALALERGISTPATIITDTPKAFYDPGTEEFWRPRNHTRRYLGDITFSRCLRSSINMCTITELEKIGLDQFLRFAKSVGLVTPKTPYQRNLTLALGSSENYPIQVAGAFRVLANEGNYSPPYLIDKIEFDDGETKYFTPPKQKRVLSPQTTFIISEILKSVIPNSQNATNLGLVECDLAGKTGTTNDARSTWFNGYSPRVIASVYLGFDNNKTLGTNEWGANTALPIWADFMGQLPVHHEPIHFDEPKGIEWRYINQGTGRVVTLDDYESFYREEKIRREAFIAGTAPSAEDEEPDRLLNEKLGPGLFLP